jgi:hypothetical protein
LLWEGGTVRIVGSASLRIFGDHGVITATGVAERSFGSSVVIDKRLRKAIRSLPQTIDY